MSCDPRLLRSFVVLADELHFGRAAARLHIAQPALSQQIKRLELQLGVELFERSRTRVELTGAGRAVLAPARAATAGVAAVEAAARAHAAGARGELRLGLSPGAHYVAQALLAELARERPEVRVRAVQDSSGALADQVERGDLDVAIAFEAEPAPGVELRPLVAEPAAVAVASTHPLAGRDTVALAELRDETFALVDAALGPGYNRAVVALCRAAGFEPRVVADPHGPMAWETAVRGAGCVGLTTRSSAPSTALDVVLVPLEPPVTFALQLLLPATAAEAPSPVVAAFVALAGAAATMERPPWSVPPSSASTSAARAASPR